MEKQTIYHLKCTHGIKICEMAFTSLWKELNLSYAVKTGNIFKNEIVVVNSHGFFFNVYIFNK